MLREHRSPTPDSIARFKWSQYLQLLSLLQQVE